MSIDFSPEEIEMIDERLDLYYKFSNKYGKNEEEMLAFLENAKQKEIQFFLLTRSLTGSIKNMTDY